ncbi:hypothetical protein DSY27_09795 [Lactobacillus helveticus]|nr:hypothetical protein DSY27_09795 [Lactobacillus helveticus]
MKLAFTIEVNLLSSCSWIESSIFWPFVIASKIFFLVIVLAFLAFLVVFFLFLAFLAASGSSSARRSIASA